MSDAQTPDGETNEKNQPEINFSFDGDVGDAIGKGVDSLKSLLGGIVDAVQEAMGPEMIQNLAAAQWLSQVAACLESAATGLREQGSVPFGTAGELTCFQERAEAELKGSKFKAQLPQMQQRLKGALDLVEQCSANADAAPSDLDIRKVADNAGYFKAAAASAVPISPSDNVE
ncbi:MAG: hypothetical protein CMJ64_03665 [Planctomycetaceae bacterium]|nr:hypothetical protein [Planctomycetaceae bacterium]